MQNTENKFKHDGLWYIAVEEESCRGCDFDNSGECAMQYIEEHQCGADKIKGTPSVIFVRSDVDNLGDEE